MVRLDSVYDKYIATVLFLIVLSTYAATISPFVGMEDDSLFVLSAYYNGISHPPGYPLYSLLAHGFSYLPLGTVAQRVHGFSAVCGSLSGVVLFFVCIKLCLHRVFAFASALSLCWSEIIWSQSIVAEVYSLNLLLFLTTFLLALSLYHNKQKFNQDIRLQIFAIFIFIGFGLSNHLYLFILSLPVLILCLLPCYISLYRHKYLVIFSFLIGMAPYAWMIVRSQSNPEWSFMGIISTLEEFVDIILRKHYSEFDIQIGANWYDRFDLIKFYSVNMVSQFSIFGFIFCIGGFIYQWNRDRYLSIALLITVLSSSYALLFAINYYADDFHKIILRVYPLVSFSIMALWWVIGFSGMIEKIPGNISVKLVLQYSSLLIPVFLLVENYHKVDHSDNQWSNTLSNYYLQKLEPDAILLIDDVSITGILTYRQKIDGIRKDIEIFNLSGYGLNNRLVDPKENISIDEITKKFITLENEGNRPIYFFGNNPFSFGADVGLFINKLNRNLAKGEQNIIVSDEDIELLNFICQFEAVDPWERLAQEGHFSTVFEVAYALRHILAEQKKWNFVQSLDEALLIQEKNVLQIIALVDFELKYNPNPDFYYLLQKLDMARSQLKNVIHQKHKAEIFNLMADIYFRLGDKVSLNKAISISKLIYPDPDNRVNIYQ